MRVSLLQRSPTSLMHTNIRLFFCDQITIIIDPAEFSGILMYRGYIIIDRHYKSLPTVPTLDAIYQTWYFNFFFSNYLQVDKRYSKVK